MTLPREFLLTDVRCFEGEQHAKLRPITLLVGENSTGKTTFLGCYSVLHHLLSLGPRLDPGPDFNREPFSMGSFRDIVRSRRGPQGRINEFKIGLKVEGVRKGNMDPFFMSITLSESGSQPTITSIKYEFNSSEYFEISRSSKEKFLVTTPTSVLELDDPTNNWTYMLFRLDQLLRYPDLEDLSRDRDGQQVIKYMAKLLMIPKKRTRRSYLAQYLLPRLPELVLLAPLRSKPKRTYDPIQEISSPDGGHVPMLMMRLNRTDDGGWRPLHDNLAAFGRGSGMFSDIRVKRHGKQMSDPFQLQVKARSGVLANIMDVGYGVSQSLPILVDIHSHQGSLFLLQQPEVHLHPRAQAELATLFVESFRTNQNSFVIETHSDYIIDRIRILVRQGKLNAEDVSILYFEPVRNAVKIHNVDLDQDGNLENVPLGYREFFLRESDRLLGFEE